MKLKIALCIPAHGHVHAKWTQCLANMISHFYSAKLCTASGEEYDKEIQTFIVSSSMLTESRHRLVAEASMADADYVLFMDSDHVFPEDALCRLWARNVDIVGVNYARRCDPTAPTAAKIVTDDANEDHKNLVYTTREKSDANELEEVSHIGLGLVLMRMGVFDKLQLHAEAEGKKSFMPLFVFETAADGMSAIGEDVYFFRKLREAGLKVHLDHALSWEVGHLYETIVTNAHAVVQEKDWLKASSRFSERLSDKVKQIEAREAEEV